MSHRSDQSCSSGCEPLNRARNFLASGDRDGWVFGVCANIARRTGWELWCVRAVAVVCLLSLTLASLLVYFILGMLMDETRPRTQQRISRWARQADKLLDALWRGIRRFFDDGEHRSSATDRSSPLSGN